MILLLRFFAALSAVVLLFAACSSEEDADEEAFAVRFSLASVPGNLTLDSLEVDIALGDTGNPQALTVDLKTGTSRTQVFAYPGQAYLLAYRLYASGFEIGAGEDEGALSKDMEIELTPTWDPARIAAARAARESGKLLPAFLETAFDKALAGKVFGIKVDSAAGHVYTWYVRLGDLTVASGTGSQVDYVPPDSLGGRTLNLKLVVKQGDKVIEERDWDVAVLSVLPSDLVEAVITRADTASSSGTYIRYQYNAEGKPDTLFYYDTTALIPGRTPVGTLAITYTQAHRPSGPPGRVVRTTVNASDIDSLFAYDAQGRLIAVTVTQASNTTVDSLAYPSVGVMVTASYGQGRLTRLLKHVKESANAEVDSIWSPVDTGLALSGLIRYALEDGKVVNLRVFRKFGNSLAAYRSEWTLYNALGSPAFRNRYEEGSTLILEQSETFSYRRDGRLDRILRRDEVTGEVVRAEEYVYQAAGPGVAAKIAAPEPRSAGSGSPGSLANRNTLLRLAEVGRHFPIPRKVP